MKRVVAVSGDKIEIRGGEVFVNGEKLAEEYLSEPYTDGEVSLEVGVDEFFVMGDNRSVSFDSRRVGTLKGSDIIGKVLLKWYPFDEFQFYKQHGEKK